MTRRDGFEIRGSLIDSAVALLLVLLAAAATLDPPGPAFTGPAWLAWLAGAAVALPVALRRRWPLPMLAVAVVSAATATATGVAGFGVLFATWVPIALLLYSAATATGPVAAALALAGGLAGAAATIPWLYLRTGVTAADAPHSEAPLWWQVELGVVAAGLATAWVAGRVVRLRRGIRADFARRYARDAVSAERLRIARELHDIVGHSLSLIAVKATVANHLAVERPAETRAALVTIEHTSRSALTEIRPLLDVLRTDDDGDDILSPSPGVGDLPELTGRLRSAGLRIDLELTGTEDLPAAIDLTVYRIVQESLTNVMKHANASRCRVAVRAGDGFVHIEVTDDGQGRRSTGRRPPGQGLIGMRERATMYGGSFTAGPGPEGGFQVVADIPYAVEEAP